jgi:hypothetical protein
MAVCSGEVCYPRLELGHLKYRLADQPHTPNMGEDGVSFGLLFLHFDSEQRPRKNMPTSIEAVAIGHHKRRSEYVLRLPPPWLNGNMLISSRAGMGSYAKNL